MLSIEFECNSCKCKDGEIEVILDLPCVICKNCKDHEEISGSDIAIHCD